jgi:Ca2+/Na+ antiporter
MLIEILSSIFGSIILLLLLAAGFAMMVSPALATRLLRKVIVAAIVYMVSVVLLQQLTVRFSFLGFLLLSPVAYVLWARRRPPVLSSQPSTRGAERTPILPSTEHSNELDS